MDAYFNEKETNPCAVYAPYRTGKSEFLYACFRKTLNNGHIALYGNLEKLLKLAVRYNTDDFADALVKVVDDQLSLIKDVFINKKNLEKYQDILFPEIKAFGVQYHPEMMKKETKGYKYFYDIVKEMSFKSTKSISIGK